MDYKDLTKAIDVYLSALPGQGKSKQTIYTYAQALKMFTEFCAATKGDEGTICAADVSAWASSMLSTCSYNSIHSRLACLRAFSAWAQRAGVLHEDLVHSSDIPRKTKPDYVLLDKEEIDLILHANAPEYHRARANLSIRDKAIVVMLLTTGMRNTELRDLRLKDLDFNQNCIYVRMGKGHKPRTVPFAKIAQDAVNEYLTCGYRPEKASPSDYLFGSDNDKNGVSTAGKEWHIISSVALNEAVKKYVKILTGKEIHCHTLRHCYTALCDHLGVSLRDISATLGHASIRTTEYVYLYVLDKKQAAQNALSLLNNI